MPELIVFPKKFPYCFLNDIVLIAENFKNSPMTNEGNLEQLDSFSFSL